jgi:hypothetical protein
MRMEKMLRWVRTSVEEAIKTGIGALNVSVFGRRALAGVKNATHD